jgi:hypothetical protein
MKNNIIKRMFIGFKKGFLTPTLPDHIIKIQSYPIIRIMRFLGGLSFLSIVGKSYLNYPIYVLYVAIFFTLLFTIYHFILTYYRIKHIITILRSDKLDIKNSPFDRFATLSARALLCFKGACEAGQPVGLTLGLMLGTDEILKAADKKAIFAHMLGEILNSILPENVHKDSRKLINNSIDQFVNNKDNIELNNSLLEKFKGLNLKGDLTKDEFNEFKQIIIENKESIVKANEKIKSKIMEMIENIGKK